MRVHVQVRCVQVMWDQWVLREEREMRGTAEEMRSMMKPRTGASAGGKEVIDMSPGSGLEGRLEEPAGLSGADKGPVDLNGSDESDRESIDKSEGFEPLWMERFILELFMGAGLLVVSGTCIGVALATGLWCDAHGLMDEGPEKGQGGERGLVIGRSLKDKGSC